MQASQGPKSDRQIGHNCIICANMSMTAADEDECVVHAGITGVKVDCQAGVGLAGSALHGGPIAALDYHSALESSVEQHFPGNHCINCMCHSTENLYRCVAKCLFGSSVVAAWRFAASAVRSCLSI